jgi:hypothetical protein
MPLYDFDEIKTHEKVVTVGNDELTVKYNDFSHIFKEYDENVKLNFWDRLTMPFIHIKIWLKTKRYEFKWACQRFKRGYDDPDWFELYNNFINRYRKILTDFKQRNQSVPMEFENDHDGWTAIIDEMLYHLNFMDETYIIDLLSKNMPKYYKPEPITVYEIMEKHKDEFFKLFSKYFFNLWD